MPPPDPPVPDRRRGHVDRRAAVGCGGRRATDYSIPLVTLARLTGMSARFFIDEIKHDELKGVKFGREWRIPTLEACRYLVAKGWPLPPWLDCDAAAAAANSPRPAA